MNKPTNISVEFGTPDGYYLPKSASYTAGGQTHTVTFYLSPYPDPEWEPRELKLNLEVGSYLPGDVLYDDIKAHFVHPDRRTAKDRLAIERLERETNTDLTLY
mgnify:CR=1 FL=1